MGQRYTEGVQMKPREYKKTIDIPHPDRVIYNFEYQVTTNLSKFIRFTLAEHAYQFEDLLKEAGYNKKGEN